MEIKLSDLNRTGRHYLVEWLGNTGPALEGLPWGSVRDGFLGFAAQAPGTFLTPEAAARVAALQAPAARREEAQVS